VLLHGEWINVPNSSVVTEPNDNPIKDILLRMDDSDLRIETAGGMRSISAGTFEATLR
jgi:hypothetical protein